MERLTGSVLLAFAIVASGCNAERAPTSDAPAPPQASEPVAPPANTTPPPSDTPPSPPPPSQTATIPARFQGNWASDAAACAVAGHESRLSIGVDRIGFHEGSGTVTSVAGGGDDLTVTAQLTGEGQTRAATYRFRLSNDGNTLTDVEGGMVRHRC